MGRSRRRGVDLHRVLVLRRKHAGRNGERHGHDAFRGLPLCACLELRTRAGHPSVHGRWRCERLGSLFVFALPCSFWAGFVLRRGECVPLSPGTRLFLEQAVDRLRLYTAFQRQLRRTCCRRLTFSSSSFFSVRLRRFLAVSSRFSAISISVSGFFLRGFGGSAVVRMRDYVQYDRRMHVHRDTCDESTTFARTA